jgi:hypothetical protein
MAPRPRLLIGWKDELLRVVTDHMGLYPNISVDLYINFPDNSIWIIVFNDNTKEKYEGLFLRRCEAEGNIPYTIALDRLHHAVTMVLPPVIDASEYEEVLACQEAMDDLST